MPFEKMVDLVARIGNKMNTRDQDFWIQTHSGIQFFPLDPRIEDICIEDIAQALSNICRFAGHCNFYSVAQHSVLVSQVVGEPFNFYGLLHDSSEAYICDIPRPIKRLPALQGYRDIEEKIQATIYERFGLEPQEPNEVKWADIQLLATEARDLMSSPPANWNLPCDPLPFTITPLPPTEAKALFMERFRELAKGFIKYGDE
jgi:uncharacterized protein